MRLPSSVWRTSGLLALVAVSGLACGPEGTDPTPVDPTRPTRILIGQVSSNKIFLGLTLQLTAVAVNDQGDTLPTVAITWTSENPAAASVSNQGLVIGLAHGPATVTARSGALSASSSLQIIELSTFAYFPHDTTLDPNQVITYSVTGADVLGSIHTNVPAVWSSNQPTLASITGPGEVTALESDGGDVQFTLTLGILVGHITMTVAPAPIATIAVSSANSWLNGAATLTYQLMSLNGTVLSNRPVVWSSSDSTIASVSQNGTVTAHSGGNASIIVTSGAASGFGTFVVQVLPAFAALADGSASCALTAAGDLYCWPQLDADPVRMASGFQFTSASVSGHTCGLTAAGAAYCWGFNNFGQLGDGTINERTLPTPVLGGLTFSQITVGGNYTCGITNSGSAYCWGINFNGQLGDSSYNHSTTPVAVSGNHTFVQLSASRLDNRATCGITTANEAWCWGDNHDGQLGTGDSVASTVPRLVTGGIAFESISVNDFHTCAVSTSQGAFCWGVNNYGGLGNGSIVNAAAPQQVNGGTYLSARVGYLFTCGIATGNELRCWGWNDSYQLGDGTQIQRQSPVTISNLNVIQVGTGSGGGCGLTIAGKVYCWGGAFHTPTLMGGQQ